MLEPPPPPARALKNPALPSSGDKTYIQLLYRIYIHSDAFDEVMHSTAVRFCPPQKKVLEFPWTY